MGLFGFGKKKQQSVPQNDSHTESNNDQPFIEVNGISYVNPNYTGELPKSDVKVTIKTNSSSWSESVDNFLARNSNAKLVKLTGKPEDFSDYSIGTRCHVEEDIDNYDRYNVTSGGDVIGRLPQSAITYAEKHDCPLEDLAVIVANVEYDFEKDRDIISVYISD